MDVTDSVGCKAGPWWEAEGCGSCGEQGEMKPEERRSPDKSFLTWDLGSLEQTTEPGVRIFACHI